MARPSRSTEARALGLLEQAMDQPSGLRAAWISAQDAPAAAKTRALALLGGSNEAAMAFVTGGAPRRAGEVPAPERIGVYRITGLIGQGGMGAVYRGERAAGDFELLVAIKVIRPGALSQTLIERFLRERQTLAQLAHPNIARLFDGGATEAGEPYIVMEFVEGRPLDAWLRAETPPLPARLDLFLAAAGAVAFAHQNLVVHGDVTPANVLVRADGQPKLIDFGIARPATPKEPVAAPGFTPYAQSGTPGYAAPERLSGQSASTLSDIYSLGRLLDHLTAGMRPNVELAAIAAKASATDAAERYATVDALCADVTAHRRGFPVAAVGRGRRYVFGKFVGRHRLGVSTALAASLLLVTALGVTLAANARAEAARAEAETRFQQTRAIATTMLFDVYDEVSKTPGATKAREKLARTGVDYLDALSRDPGAPLPVRVEAGLGYVRLAQVTGGGQSAQLGKYADGTALLAKAETVLRAAYAVAPDDPDVGRAMGDLLLEQAGQNLYNNSQIALGRRQTVEAQAILKPLALADAATARRYATAIQTEGDSYGWDGDNAQARVHFLRAEAFMAGLPPALRDDTDVMKARSANLRLLAEAQHHLNDDAASIASMTRAVAINEALLKRAPGSPEVSRKLALSLWYQAVVLLATGRTAEGYASVDRSVSLARGLRARDPEDRGATQLFAVVGEVRAQALAELERFPESFAMGEETIAAHRQIVDRASNAAGARRSMAATLKTVGGNYYNGRAFVQACQTWQRARDVYEGLIREGSLTGYDRTNALPELVGWMREGCDPPRAGMRPIV